MSDKLFVILLPTTFMPFSFSKILYPKVFVNVIITRGISYFFLMAIIMKETFSMLKSRKSPLMILLVIIFFVYADIICENIIIIVNDQLSRLKAITFLFTFLVLQVVFAALQSGLSDFFGRKKSLIASLSVSIVSLLCVFVYSQQWVSSVALLFAALLVKGFWGNTTPIAFAAIADTQKGDYRGAFALASGTYSLGFITLVLINMVSKGNFFHIIIACIVLILALVICILMFKDTSDKTAHLPPHASLKETHSFISTFWRVGVKEINLLLNEIKRPLTKTALSAYLLWEVSMYSIIISQIDLNPGPSQRITLAMMAGYLTGIFILKLKPCAKVKDISMVTIGYLTAFLSLIPYFFLSKYVESQNLLLGICFYLHAVGNAFLSPSILSILAKNRSTHDQGKILGLAESADTIAFLLATIAVMFYAGYKWPVVILVGFSFISFSISWFYFPIIKKLDKLIYK